MKLPSHLCRPLRLLQLSALAVQPRLPLSQQALALRNLTRVREGKEC